MFSFFKKRYILTFLCCGVILFICYLISGIMGETLNKGVLAGTAVVNVLTSPFSNHFNDFTPVVMIFGFVLFELGCMLMYFRDNIFVKRDKKDSDNAKSTKGANEAAVPNYSSIEETETEDPESPEDVVSGTSSKKVNLSAFGFVVPDEFADKTDDEGVTDKKENNDMAEFESSDPVNSDEEEIPDKSEDDISSFSSEVFWDLNGDYTPDQIKEMVQLKRYMYDIDVATLRKTFKPSLSAEEIREYIELFYG